MNKEEILEEINKTKEHLVNMEKMLKECEYERWKPEKNEVYYFVNSYGVVEQDWNSTEFIPDMKRYNAYNCFQTEEQAKAEAAKIVVRRELEDIARRLNKDKEINWNNHSQFKYYIMYDYEKDILDSANACKYRRQGTVYCLDNHFLNVVIQEIGEERLKKYLRGE